MPPTFRSSRSGRQFGDGANRTRTGQVDHDVFEGLPVRRWTRQTQTVSQVPKTDASETILPGPGGKQTIPEHPMPRDSHLLTPASRALLRASRAGCIYIRQTATKEEDDEEKDATDVEEQPVLQSSERSFVTRKWTTVPKHLEPAEVEFLAKRRPGLQSLYGAAAAAGAEGANASQPMRRTRFKKVDPASGNISVYEAWVPEGHKIEGEIANDAQVVPENPAVPVTVTPEAPAPGTVIEGVGVVNAEGVVVAEAGSAAVMTPPKRRPPPPKRKAKGFGKGRRKKVMFAPGEGTDASLVHGAGTGADGTQEKDGDASSRVSADHPGQEDEDDDGEEGEESDEGDESMMEAKTPETPMQQAGAEPVSESAAEQTPASTTDAVADTKLSETPQPSLQIPEASATPAASEEPTRPAGDGVATALAEQTEQKVAAEDVEMTDSKPDVPVQDTITATIPPPVTVKAETPAEETPAAAQETPQPEPILPTESKDQPMEEPVHDTKEPSPAEPTTLAPPVPAQDADAMDVSADEPQASPEKAPATELPPAQAVAPSGEKQEDSNDVDMLDSLEASLNRPVESEPEKQPEQADQAALADTITESVTEQPTPADIKQPSPVEAVGPSAEPTPIEPEKLPEQPIETLGENPTEQASTEQAPEPAAPTEPVPTSTEETPASIEPTPKAPIPEKSPEEPEQPTTQQEPESAPEPASEPQQAEEQAPAAEPSPKPAPDQPEAQEQARPTAPAEEASAPPTDETPAPQAAQSDPEPQEPTPAQPAQAPSSTENDTPVATAPIPEPEKSEEAEAKPVPVPVPETAGDSEPKPETEARTTTDNNNTEGSNLAAESSTEQPPPAPTDV